MDPDDINIHVPCPVTCLLDSCVICHFTGSGFIHFSAKAHAGGQLFTHHFTVIPLSKSELRNTSASVCLFSLRKIDQSVPSNMKRVNMVDMFSYPDSYQPPEDAHLAANSHYPNLNSREYLNLDVDESLKIQKYHDIFEVNQLGNVVLGCNDYTARIWSGSFWGFDRIANYGSEDASYKLRCKSNVTNVKYVEDNMVFKLI